jgi:hypothetical protein
METKNTFSFQRFRLLCNQSMIINKRLITLWLGGFAGILFVALFLFQLAAGFARWENESYLSTFVSLFFVMGVIYVSNSFPAFSSKERSMSYLMLPASASEKYIFELLTRIVLFILVVPFIFWAVANLEGQIVHQFVPTFTHYQCSFDSLWSGLLNHGNWNGWGVLLAFQGVLFVFCAFFAGASHFAKSAFLKTLLTFLLLMAGFAFYSYLISRLLGMSGMHPANDRILTIHSKEDGVVHLAIVSTIVNVCLLAIAWFKLKEKEA